MEGNFRLETAGNLAWKSEGAGNEITLPESNRNELKPVKWFWMKRAIPPAATPIWSLIPFSGRPKAEALDKLSSNTESGLFSSTNLIFYGVWNKVSN